MPKKVVAKSMRLGDVCEGETNYKSYQQLQKENCGDLVIKIGCILKETGGTIGSFTEREETYPNLKKSLLKYKRQKRRLQEQEKLLSEKEGEASELLECRRKISETMKQILEMEGQINTKFFNNVQKHILKKKCDVIEIIKNDSKIMKLFGIKQ